MKKRGLESLIPKKNNEDYDEGPSQKESVFWVEVDKIKVNPYQQRAHFDEEDLDSLAESIKRHGILQPLIVSKISKNEYELVAGERRLRAAKQVNIDKVPVIIRAPDEQEKLELALIENVQRRDLNPMEKAEAFKRLRDEFDLRDWEIAKIMGKSREVITNTVRFLNLTSLGKNALRAEQIFEGHAKVLLSLPKDEQNRFIKMIIKEKLTVRQLEKRVRDFKNPRKPLNLEDQESLDEFENRFKKVLKYDNIKIKGNKKNYQVVIKFKTAKEMEDWIDNL